MTRASVDVDTLLKIVLGLVIVWLVLEVLGALLSITGMVFRMLPQLLGIAIVVLIVLYLTDNL
ncbi:MULTISPECIES: DUF7554 family protein [unclassified Haloparvum]|uniref:DUF7554 family protein n=1 Tax=Haloparvum sp. PAK95 TaxID=3418962 RepID=UPI003D2EF089